MNSQNNDWMLEEVSPEARLAAANAAKAAGISLGDWISGVVREFVGTTATNPNDDTLYDEKLTSIERAMLRARSNAGK